MASVYLTDAAIADLSELDGSVLPRVLKKLLLLESIPEAGAPLGRRSQSDLTTFRKLFVGNRDWRIIYRIEDDGDIAVVWVIAGRSDDECYEEAVKRVEGGDPGVTTILTEALMHLSVGAQRKAARIFHPPLGEESPDR